MKNKKLLVPLLSLLLTSCMHEGKKPVTPQPSPSAEELYRAGSIALEKREYSQAAKFFQELDTEYPESNLAPLGEIRTAYAYYESQKYDDVLVSVHDFIAKYPVHRHVAYMYYLKAITYYDQIVDIERDQKITLDAIESFESLINKFPNTKYAVDAKLKLQFCRNSLAGQEMSIGKFYLTNRQPTAALNRFRKVVSDYQDSIFIEEALYRLVEIYYSLGIIDEATKYAAVLHYNYPNKEWDAKSRLLLERQ